MSDGPLRSLPMRPGWRKLAERADTAAFEREEIVEAIPPALAGDWRKERCAELLRGLLTVLGNSEQGSLAFAETKAEELEKLSKLSGAGSPMRKRLLDYVWQAIDEGKCGRHALEEGIANALADQCAAGIRQVEEHLRGTAKHRAANVRKRLEDAACRADLKAMARDLVKSDARLSAAPLKKNDDLDDGVRL